jgi:short-subunit dehydrogenase
MLELNGAFTLLTGAAGGLGPHIARALAERGCRLALSAHPDHDLEPVAESCRALGVDVCEIPVDLAQPGAPEQLAAAAEDAHGGLDLLVNNAGIEQFLAYDHLDVDAIERIIAINLAAPMRIARAVLPGMLQRGRGHIVNMASLAGIGPPPFAATYAATKAGVIGFTKAIRAEYRSRGVSASVIAPGFVRDEGMFARMAADTGTTVPMLAGSCTTLEVARAVVESIDRDTALTIVNGGPIRILQAMDALFPTMADHVMPGLGITELFTKWAAYNEAAIKSAPVSAERLA